MLLHRQRISAVRPLRATGFGGKASRSAKKPKAPWGPSKHDDADPVDLIPDLLYAQPTHLRPFVGPVEVVIEPGDIHAPCPHAPWRLGQTLPRSLTDA